MPSKLCKTTNRQDNFQLLCIFSPPGVNKNIADLWKTNETYEVQIRPLSFINNISKRKLKCFQLKALTRLIQLLPM